ncbi:3-dehydroquinate synthase [Buchnera aphidicola (Ceratoglyphina bambusae)]|uniref:3-dehydroquinate synthase n=1 Tax=Buchnera aphidicola TaxID=9 RepID=UPI0031B87D5F
MKTLYIKLKKTKYFIKIGNNIFNDKNIISIIKSYKKVVLITNSTLFNIYNKDIIKNFEKLKIFFKKIVLPDGEVYKTLNTIETIINYLIKMNCGRDVTLIAFGGGVIGDITGFAASIYKRGIKYINIPTTLLSQVDASIGGKTGVNNNLVKNVIGTFHQPECVLIDINFLKTLSIKEFSSGLSEVIKYAILFDKNFFFWIKENLKKILCFNKNILSYCIYKCCNFKKNIICKDEKEHSIRMILNLGHTFGHAIEIFTKHNWLHGESVSAGIVMSSFLSKYLGKIKKKQLREIINLFKSIELPVLGPKRMKFSDYYKHMSRDKKNVSNNKIVLVIPEKIGKCILLNDVNKKLLSNFFNKYFSN